jgi:tetratricopeptide (TPR) repeat protein
MVVSLDSRRRVATFVVVIAALVAAFSYETGRVVLTKIWGDSYDVDKVQRAIRLDPHNPEHRYWLGMLFLAGNGGDAVGSVPWLQNAVAVNPNVAKYWLGLAHGCFAIGDRRCADQAFQRAIDLAPAKPEMHWDTAIYYAVSSDTSHSIGHLKRLLELRPDRINDVLLLSWRAFDDPDLVWRELIKPSDNVSIQTAYVEFLSANGRADLTSRYWPEMAQHIGGTRFASYRLYLQHLLEVQQYEQVGRVWQDLLSAGIVTPRETSCLRSGASSNLVFNPCFDPTVNGGFDWLISDQQSAVVNFPSREENEHGVEIDFSVPHNAEDEPVYQVIPVAPNATYELTANVRSDGITSDSGPRLRVVDLRCPTCLNVSTDGTTGTTAWHEVRLVWSSGPNTRFVRLSVWRPPSRTYPMEISGRAWFDAVTLRQMDSPK